jgi:hypothetical protein
MGINSVRPLAFVPDNHHFYSGDKLSDIFRINKQASVSTGAFLLLHFIRLLLPESIILLLIFVSRLI